MYWQIPYLNVGRAVAEVVSRWPLTSETFVRSHTSPHELVVDKVVVGQVSFQYLLFCDASIPTLIHTDISFIYHRRNIV